MKKTLISISLVSLGVLSSVGATTYKGDLNGDGKVDLADMVYLANAINSGSANTACDINASGKVDDTDLHKLADIIISGVLTENSGLNVGIGGWDDDGTDYGGTVRSRAMKSRSVQETSFYIRNPKALGTDDRHSVEFGISDASETAAAILFNIELPANLQFDDNLIVELDNSILDGHELYGTPKVNRIGDNDWDNKNVLRFIVFNPALKPFSSAVGPLGRIRYSGNDTFGIPRYINCQILNANGAYVADVHEHESEGINWHEIIVSSISLNNSSINLIEGDNYQLDADIYPDDATYKDITWTSSDESVTTVDSNGYVRAIGPGAAIITVESVAYPSVTASCSVTVEPRVIEVAGLILDRTDVSIIVGESVSLSATILPEDATDKTVTWVSSNPDVVSVSGGNLTALNVGTSTITVYSSNGMTASCTVTVAARIIEVTGVTINRTDVDMKVGDVMTLAATVLPEDATDKSLSWSSDNVNVVTVDASGNVTANALGEATITVTCGSATAACVVRVIATPVESITLSQTELNLTEGESAILTATVTQDDATDKTVTWTSSSPDVVSVSDGNLTARKTGSSTITVSSSNGMTASCLVTVAAKIIEVTGVTINCTDIEMKVGETVTLMAAVLPEDATDKLLSWSSDNVNVVSVDTSGNITANALGKATIMVTCGSATAACVVRVVATPVEGITLSQTELNLTEGESATLIATVTPYYATDKTVTWTSSSPDVVSVSDGNLTARKAGSSTITVYSSNGMTASCTVTVAARIIEVTGVTISRTDVDMKVGEVMTLTATVLPEDATDKSLSWSSDNVNVVTVDASGNVTANALGEATITVACGSATATCVVRVIATPVEGIILNSIELNLAEGETTTLVATVTPDNATEKDVIWSSDNESVVIVDEKGRITTRTSGTAIITVASVAYPDIRSLCYVTVTKNIISVSDISLNVSKLDMIEGDIANLTVTITPADATDKTITWISSNSEVVSAVDGMITAEKAGTATISAVSSNGMSATCSVTVSARIIEATEIILNHRELDLKVGEVMTLSATVIPEETTYQDIVWTSENDAIATVDSNGYVTAITVGETAIVATCGNITSKCIITVTPILAETLTITPNVWSGEEGNSFSISALVTPDNTTDKSLAWESSDINVAIVDVDGTVTVKKAGECKITVSTLDGSNLVAECAITSRSGLDLIFSDDQAEADVYTLNGILIYRNCSREKINQLQTGVYILRRQSGHSIVYIHRNN